MAIKVYLNGTQIPYKDGIPITFTGNEQLDSGVLVVPNVTEKLSIKRNDAIRINISSGNDKYFLVAGFSYSLASMNKPYLYTYEITLVSYAMKLQSYLLPNITITQPLSNKRSIYFEAFRIRAILGLASTYTFSTYFYNKTKDTICPELSFNRRNFWEILNTLLEVVNCVVTMSSTTQISCISLDNINSQIDPDKIVSLQFKADANEYCSELEMNAQNVVGDHVSSASQYWISPRSSSYIMDTDNAQLILDKPIYCINKVLINFTTQDEIEITDPTREIIYDSYASNSNLTFDITKWVVEESVYNTKLPSASTPYWSDTAFELKKYFLSYKEGSEIIDNLCYTEKVLFNTLMPTIYNIIAYEIYHDFVNDNPDKPDATLPNDFESAMPDVRNILFNVDYVSLNTIRFRTKKETSDSLNEKVLASNQTSSYVDAEALGKSEQSSANRIGNEYYELTLINYTPVINDYYLDNGVKYYLSKYQIRYTNIGDTYVTGIFTKDFIQKDLFTGINSKARYTSIATGSDVLLRQDILNLKFTIDSEQTSVIDWNTLFSSMWINLGKRTSYEALVKTDSADDFFKLPISTYLLGNNHFIMEFRFKNNASAGLIVDSTVSNKYVCKDVLYVDEDGEFVDIDFTIQRVNENDTNQSLQAKKYPVAYENGIKVTAFSGSATVISKNARKDNREIYGICVNLEIISSNENVELTDYFYEQLPFVCDSESSELFLYLGENIDATEQIYLAEDINNYITCEGQYVQVYIQSFCTAEGIAYSTLTEWGICDGNNNKLIIVKDKTINKLYFNNIS